MDPKRLFFFDEFSLNLNMTRRYALAPSNERAYGMVPVNPGVTMTLVLGLGLQGIVAPCAIVGAMNGHVFGSYFAESVLPHLPPGAIAVVDNAPAHHSEDARDALAARGVLVADSLDEVDTRPEASGIQMWFLPPYSPELTPVEECGSKIKMLTRSADPRTKEALIDAMGSAIGRVTPQDARGWFDHARRGRAPRPPKANCEGTNVLAASGQPRAGPADELV